MTRLYTDVEVEATLRAILRANEPEVQRLLFGTWNRQRSAITQMDLISGVADGTMTPATLKIWQDQYIDFVNNRLTPLWRVAASANMNFVGQALMSAFPAYTPRFPQALARIDRWVATRGGRLIVGLGDLQLKAVNSILRHHIVNDPLSATELGQVLRPAIGLTPREALAVKNRRLKLIEDGLSGRRLNEQAARYAAQLQRVRADRIARTELTAAFNQGGLENINESIAAGDLTPEVLKQWWTSLDERVCVICEPLHEKTKPLGEPFVSKGRSAQVPPIHPSCRDTIIYIVDEDAQLGLA